MRCVSSPSVVFGSAPERRGCHGAPPSPLVWEGSGSFSLLAAAAVVTGTADAAGAGCRSFIALRWPPSPRPSAGAVPPHKRPPVVAHGPIQSMPHNDRRPAFAWAERAKEVLVTRPLPSLSFLRPSPQVDGPLLVTRFLERSRVSACSASRPRSNRSRTSDLRRRKPRRPQHFGRKAPRAPQWQGGKAATAPHPATRAYHG